jgi:hypothetical protein
VADRDKCIPLPADADLETLSRLCHEHSARLDDWIEEQRKAEPSLTKTRYDGTVASACRVYQEHPHSKFSTKIKFNTRATYLSSLRLIEATVGKRLIRNVMVPDVEYWYQQWRKPAAPGATERIKRAHEAVSVFRTVIYFLASLRYADCKQLAEELERVKFEKAGARTQAMTPAHASAFIRTALDLGRRKVMPADRALSMAIGVAAQFDLLVRQKDIIGEWAAAGANRKLPVGITIIDRGTEAWAGYFTWESIPGWRWRMKTSKSKYRAAGNFNLTEHGLLFPLLELVPHDQRHGAIVKGEGDLPVRQTSYGKWFRQIARAAGIPDDVWNMDSRAGGATEAKEAGAALKDIQGAMTHAEEGMTLRYIRRGPDQEISAVAQARSRKRAADQGDGTA